MYVRDTRPRKTNEKNIHETITPHNQHTHQRYPVELKAEIDQRRERKKVDYLLERKGNQIGGGKAAVISKLVHRQFDFDEYQSRKEGREGGNRERDAQAHESKEKWHKTIQSSKQPRVHLVKSKK